MRKQYQSPGRMKNSSYYIAPAGDRTHDLPHTVASNTGKVSHALNHSVKEAVLNRKYGQRQNKIVSSTLPITAFYTIVYNVLVKLIGYPSGMVYLANVEILCNYLHPIVLKLADAFSRCCELTYTDYLST